MPRNLEEVSRLRNTQKSSQRWRTYTTPRVISLLGLVCVVSVEKVRVLAQTRQEPHRERQWKVTAPHLGKMQGCSGCCGIVKLDGSDSPGITSTWRSMGVTSTPKVNAS